MESMGVIRKVNQGQTDNKRTLLFQTGEVDITDDVQYCDGKTRNKKLLQDSSSK